MFNTVVDDALIVQNLGDDFFLSFLEIDNLLLDKRHVRTSTRDAESSDENVFCLARSEATPDCLVLHRRIPIGRHDVHVIRNLKIDSLSACVDLDDERGHAVVRCKFVDARLTLMCRQRAVQSNARDSDAIQYGYVSVHLFYKLTENDRFVTFFCF